MRRREQERKKTNSETQEIIIKYVLRLKISEESFQAEEAKAKKNTPGGLG